MRVHTFSLDQHLILFQPAKQRLYILNPTAGWIWQSAADGVPFPEITSSLAAHYNLSKEVIESDIRTTLEYWLSRGLNPADQDVEDQPVPPVVVDMTPPVDTNVNFQAAFKYGQSSFTLVDHTLDLKSDLQPLLASLGAPEQDKTENRIVVYQDNDQYVIGCNGVELERTPIPNVAVGRMIQAMIENGYPKTTWMAFIHASAGALDGQGVIFSGIGGSGKSTLMAALAQSGWTYWCDDTVPLDIAGRAGAVPLGHCLKSGSWDVLAPYYPGLADQPVFQRYGKDVRYQLLDSAKTGFTETMPVHRLVFPVYESNCTQSLDPIPPVEGLQRLIDAQTWISPDTAHVEKLLHWISSTPVYTLHFHSLDWAIGQLNELLQDG